MLVCVSVSGCVCVCVWLCIMWDTRLAIAWRLLLTLTHAVMNFFFYVSLNEKETQVGLSITIIAVHSIEIDLKLAALQRCSTMSGMREWGIKMAAQIKCNKSTIKSKQSQDENILISHFFTHLYLTHTNTLRTWRSILICVDGSCLFWNFSLSGLLRCQK